ncbi:MAG: hypothetical protein CBD27_03905 [Rhodospirillaceae bacterium TMED167]|nr:hypothetical protein [Rhodospirillaceae bacterium]OUW28800.1 MAG: hypothetical protein CBD27_03905 [Rhodospirillaceae bacterium TMED167]
MTFMPQYIKANYGKFILAKISISAERNSPSAVILPGNPVENRAVVSFAEMLTDHGFACCLPSTEVDVQDANKNSSRSISHRTNSWNLGELDHAMRHMRSAPGSNGKIAVIGFGEGGRQAYLAACRLNPEAAIIYHGIGIDAFLEEGRHIDCQTIFHAGKDDPHMMGEKDRRIHAALIGKFNIAIYKYDAGEAFTNEDDPLNYVLEAARLAHKRTLDVLCQLT